MQKPLLRALGKSGFDFEAVSVFTRIGMTGIIKIIREERPADEYEQEVLAEVLDHPREELFDEYGYARDSGNE